MLELKKRASCLNRGGCRTFEREKQADYDASFDPLPSVLYAYPHGGAF